MMNNCVIYGLSLCIIKKEASYFRICVNNWDWQPVGSGRNLVLTGCIVMMTPPRKTVSILNFPDSNYSLNHRSPSKNDCRFQFLSIVLPGLLGRQGSLFGRFFFFCWLSLGLVVWPRLGCPFVSQNPGEVYAFLL